MLEENRKRNNLMIAFQEAVDAIALPERFTFPFYYEPHPLCVLAVKELQKYLSVNTWEHNFGLIKKKDGPVIGKMFGVLVVKNKNGDLGYLAAFSGKLTGENNTANFVPSLFNLEVSGSFLTDGMLTLKKMGVEITALEEEEKFKEYQSFLISEKDLEAKEIAAQKQLMRETKKARKAKRIQAKLELPENDFKILEEALIKESQGGNIRLTHLKRDWKKRILAAENQLKPFKDKIFLLKEKRKNTSIDLQQKLFNQYQFLNQAGVKKSLSDIFKDFEPPSGAGECAAPKLLQYAFEHQLTPICMAEFWWGQSPSSEIRKHQQFYPACRGKCEPILEHMLADMDLDENPLLQNPAIGKKIDIVYEDKSLLVIHKPAEFLSVPGKHIRDSVATRLKKKYPNATGPLIVHRLDMSTSGLMLIAKSEEVHKYLQRQFIKRTIKKRYVAILEGVIKEKEGLIDLPLRVDINDRPRQLVCYDYGKSAQTKYEVIKIRDGQTRVHFFPISGRTHQLRMHASHQLGLNKPIVGDDLYGKKAERLYLHAEFIEFLHPVSGERMGVERLADF